MAKFSSIGMFGAQLILLMSAGCDRSPTSVSPAAQSAPVPVEAVTPSEPVGEEVTNVRSREAPPASLPAPIDTPPESSPSEPDSSPSPAQTSELWHDPFADVMGSIYWNRDGK